MKLVKLLLFVLVLSCSTKVFTQSQANCDNIYLSMDTIFLIPDFQTEVTGDLFYNDTIMTFYPTLLLQIPENPYITTTDIMVLSSLDSGFVQPYVFNMNFVNTDFPNNTVIPILLHIFDSDMPGDSIVTCYYPITLILKTDNSAIASSISDAISVYPNPSSGDVFVTCSSEFIGKTLTITSILGEVIYSNTLSTEKQLINAATFPKGVYVVSVNRQTINKIVISD